MENILKTLFDEFAQYNCVQIENDKLNLYEYYIIIEFSFSDSSKHIQTITYSQPTYSDKTKQYYKIGSGFNSNEFIKIYYNFCKNLEETKTIDSHTNTKKNYNLNLIIFESSFLFKYVQIKIKESFSNFFDVLDKLILNDNWEKFYDYIDKQQQQQISAFVNFVI